MGSDLNKGDPKAFDVFICYSPRDKIVADGICSLLESLGIRCWIAPRDLLQNTDYATASVQAIENCYMMIVVLSFSSNDSPVIIRDLNKAVTQKLIIIPYRIDDVIPSKSMKYLLGGMDCIDALDGRGSLSLVNEVQHFLSEVKEGKREKQIFLIKAGLLERFGAYVIDGIIIIFLPFFLYWVLRFYIPSIPSIDNPDTFVFYIFFMWLTIISYFISTEASRWRGTFGKKVCNLIVTTPTNERASLFQIVLRNVTKCCTVFFPFTLVIVLIPAFVTENKQTLYDLLSGTVVQKNPVSWKRYKNIDKETLSV